MKTLVIYYSRKGTVKHVAEGIAKALEADIEEIIDTKSRKGILGFIMAGRDATTGNLTEIAPVKSDLSKYDLVVVGTPVWASHFATPVKTFLKQNYTKINKIAVFAVSAGEGQNKAAQDVEAEVLKKPAAQTIISGKDIRSGMLDFKIKEFKELINSID
jgi:menaquinone-dependent protoporphyrinogen IX oxidase